MVLVEAREGCGRGFEAEAMDGAPVNWVSREGEKARQVHWRALLDEEK